MKAKVIAEGTTMTSSRSAAERAVSTSCEPSSRVDQPTLRPPTGPGSRRMASPRHRPPTVHPAPEPGRLDRPTSAPTASSASTTSETRHPGESTAAIIGMAAAAKRESGPHADSTARGVLRRGSGGGVRTCRTSSTSATGSGSWVAVTTAPPRARCESSRPVTAARVPRSCPTVGSSARTALGPWARAAATASRRCSPPERVCGSARSGWARPRTSRR
uniref:Uncharacterized protein n=1 Tax=Janibacter limosus TaxID=53458 RepID=A0AC61U3D0_9MICO|nr:hypothetical protein [Janibacter limosus]